MRTFIFTSAKFSGEAEIAYSPAGAIYRIENRSDMSDKQMVWLLSNLPLAAGQLLPWSKHFGLTVVEIPENLDFDTAFWPIWPGPVANRARALDLWKKMSKADQSRCLFGLPAYRRYIGRTKAWYNPKYPDGYLRGKYYENEWDKMHR